MLDTQLEGFEAEGRLLDATLGVQSLASALEALARVPRTSEGPRPSPELVDFFLGFLSASRTLRAALGAGAELTRQAPMPGSLPDLSRVLSLR